MKPRRKVQLQDTPKTAACAFTLTQGQPGEERDICVTAKQAARLFGNKKPKKIGCGVYACAYEGPRPGTVTKITNDPSDVGALIKAQGTPWVPKVHAAFRMRSPVKWRGPIDPLASPRAFALVVERLAPLPVKQKKQVRCIGYNLNRIGGGIEKAVAACCPTDDDSCANLSVDIGIAQHQLKAQDIDWHDIHEGNVGYDAQGNLKVLDVGLSETPPPKDLPLLGARRQRRTRRRRTFGPIDIRKSSR